MGAQKETETYRILRLPRSAQKDWEALRKRFYMLPSVKLLVILVRYALDHTDDIANYILEQMKKGEGHGGETEL